MNPEAGPFRLSPVGQNLISARGARNLDWSSRSASGNAVMLGNKSSSSTLDCFHEEGGGNDEVAFMQDKSTSLCLNVAGNSHSVGAWVILYPCNFLPEELWKVGDSLPPAISRGM